MSELLEPAVAATRLNKTVHWLAKKRMRGATGGPPYIKIGRTVRYRATDLDKYIDKQTIGRIR